MNDKMRRHRLLLVGFVLLCFAQHASAQQTVVAASRSIDWSKAGVTGGIPARLTICATLNPGATAAQISTALTNCPAGQTVFLNAGTYNLTSGNIKTIGKSNVTLRGAGADQTLLIFTSSADCWGQPSVVCFRAVDNNYAGGGGGGVDNSATVTGAGPWPKGTTQVTLSNTTNLAVGGIMILDQVDDLSDGGVIYNCEQSATLSPSQNPPCNDDSGATGGDSGAQRGSGTSSVRGQQQVVTITAINGNTVTFSPGLYASNWRVFTDSRGTNTPGAWWVTNPVFGMGIENLSINMTNSSGFLGTMLYNCSNCWVKGIRSINGDRDHVAIYYSAHATVRDSYFYGTKNAVSQSYGIEAYGTSDDLIENNIFQHIAVPQMINSDCEGCVVGYNFSINDFYAASSNWLMQSIFLHSLTSNILVEGNVGAGLYADLFHGTHNFITIFRNRYDGNEPNNGNAVTGHANPLLLFPYSRFFNVVGNVLGTSSYHTNYIGARGSSGNTQDHSIYVIGTGPVTCCQSGDPLVQSTLMLWGNYDTVNNAVRFVNAEVPSGIANFPNPVPPDQTLPASFYLSAKPGWWPAGKPWPAIGPDVTGGNIPNVGGHAYTIPAQDCYTTRMGGPADGSGNVLSFNASTCYPAAGTPAVPTNLRIVR